MLYLAMVDKLNRAGFVMAPYNTPEEVPNAEEREIWLCGRSDLKNGRRQWAVRRETAGHIR